MKVELLVGAAPVMQVCVLMEVAVIDPALGEPFDPDRVARATQRSVPTADLKTVGAFLVCDDVRRDVVQQGRIVLEPRRPHCRVNEFELVALVVVGQRPPIVAGDRLHAESLPKGHVRRRVHTQPGGVTAHHLEKRIAAVVARLEVGPGNHDAEIEEILGIVQHPDAFAAAEIEVHLVAGVQRTGLERCTRRLAVGEHARDVASRPVAEGLDLQPGPRGGGLHCEVSGRARFLDLKLLHVTGEMLPDLDGLALRYSCLPYGVLDPDPVALARLDHRGGQELHAAFEGKPWRHIRPRPVLDAQALRPRVLRLGKGEAFPPQKRERRDSQG